MCNVKAINDFSVFHNPIEQIAELTNSIFIKELPANMNLCVSRKKIAIVTPLMEELKNNFIQSRLHDSYGILTNKSRLSSLLLNTILLACIRYKLIRSDNVTVYRPNIRSTWKYSDHLIHTTGSKGMLLCSKTLNKPLFSNNVIETICSKSKPWGHVYEPYFGLCNESKNTEFLLCDSSIEKHQYYPNIFLYTNQHNSSINTTIGR
ncbi:hypothetical protein MXB_2827, partial [Myxobolus squamalis]